MKWVMLTLAGLFEVTWACAMKYSNGFTAPLPSAVTAGGKYRGKYDLFYF